MKGCEAVGTYPSATLYIRLYKKKHIPHGTMIRLGDIAQFIVDEQWQAPLHALCVTRATREEGTHLMIEILQVIHLIKAHFPSLQIEHFGDPHILIDMTVSPRKPRMIWLFAVWCLLFVGSGLAIMNFHEDVSMLKVHQRLSELLTGTRDETPRLIQVSYSLGIGLGMVIFFNHFFKKKLNDEPSPLEVEMFTYDESIHQYILTEEYEKLQSKTKTEGQQ